MQISEVLVQPPTRMEKNMAISRGETLKVFCDGKNLRTAIFCPTSHESPSASTANSVRTVEPRLNNLKFKRFLGPKPPRSDVCHFFATHTHIIYWRRAAMGVLNQALYLGDGFMFFIVHPY